MQPQPLHADLLLNGILFFSMLALKGKEEEKQDAAVKETKFVSAVSSLHAPSASFKSFILFILFLNIFNS